MPEAGIPADRDIKESAADENRVICLVSAGIVDRYSNGSRTTSYTEDKSTIIGIINTANSD